MLMYKIEITPETMGVSTTSGAGTPTLYYYCSNHSGMGGESALSLYASGSGSGGAGASFDEFLRNRSIKEKIMANAYKVLGQEDDASRNK